MRPRTYTITVLLLGIWGLVIKMPAQAQYMLKDINVTELGSKPSFMTTLGERFIFWATDDTHGTELWVSDGTPEGTMLVGDLAPGSASSKLSEFTTLGGVAFFHDDEALWVTDGTQGGTYRLRQFERFESYHGITRLGDRIYFSADDGVHGRELWQSDGTVAGTIRLTDLRPGAESSSPGYFVPFRGDLYFYAHRGTNGEGQLWRTDGTTAGTHHVLNFVFVPEAALGDSLLLGVGFEETYGQEVWVTDGTSAGTQVLLDIAPGNLRSDPSEITAWNDLAFFAATDQEGGPKLWVTDGTPGGTRLVQDAHTGGYLSSPYNFVATPEALLVEAWTQEMGREYWRTDGTPEGTYVLKDIAPGSASSSSGGAVVFNEQIFFRASDGQHGAELWVSNGTATGTHLFKDINPGIYHSTPRNFAVTPKGLVFNANDGQTGAELWLSDGTPEGTKRLVNLRQQGNASSSPRAFVPFKNQWFFRADDGVDGNELWVTDGTEDGTKLLKDLWLGPRSASPDALAVHNQLLWFIARNSEGAWLWQSDGTSEGTQPAIPLHQETYTFHMIPFGNEFLCVYRTDEAGYELGITDLASGELRLVKDVYPGPSSSDIDHFFHFEGKVYFYASDGVHGGELWTSDGTPAGTMLVKDIEEGSGSARISNFTIYDKHLYFRASDDLWRTDGTADGTVAIAPEKMSSPEELYAWKGHLYFQAHHRNSGIELWRTDGTHDGTHIVKDINRVSVFQNGSSSPHRLIGTEDALYFIAEGPNDVPTLWRTDGTETGTWRVVANRSDSFPIMETIYGLLDGLLLLSGDDGVHGRELWVSDGTDAGTRMVADVQRGAARSIGRLLYLGDDQVIINMNDGTRGWEPWVFDRQVFSVARSSETPLVTSLQLDTIYPNPVRTQAYLPLVVDRTQHVSVHVYDVLGREVERIHEGVLRGNTTHMLTTQTASWASGMYIVQVVGEYERASRRIVKVR